MSRRIGDRDVFERLCAAHVVLTSPRPVCLPFTDFGATSAESGPSLANYGQLQPNIARIWPNLA